MHINSTSTRMSIKLMGARDPEEISDCFQIRSLINLTLTLTFDSSDSIVLDGFCPIISVAL